jgi:hypothetical protein
MIHIHPPDGGRLQQTSLGTLMADRVAIPATVIAGKTEIVIDIS